MGVRTALWTIALVCCATLASALTDPIELPRARRGVVTFPHLAHAEDYGIACDRCHHNIRATRPDTVDCKGCHLSPQHQGLCHDCHISTRDPDYTERDAAVRARLGKASIPPLFKAFHGLCRDCHKQSNARDGTKAPYECGGCHR